MTERHRQISCIVECRDFVVVGQANRGCLFVRWEGNFQITVK